MKNATQPKGMSLTPGNCSRPIRSWLDEVGDAGLVESPRASQTPSDAGLIGAVVSQVDAPAPRRDRGRPSRRRSSGPTSMAISVTRPNPCAPRTTSGRSPTTLSGLPPRWSTSSSLVTITGWAAHGRDRLDRAGERVDRIRARARIPDRPARAGRMGLRATVANRLPVAPDGDDEVSAVPDPFHQRLALQTIERLRALPGRRCRSRSHGPHRSRTIAPGTGRPGYPPGPRSPRPRRRLSPISLRPQSRGDSGT